MNVVEYMVEEGMKLCGVIEGNIVYLASETWFSVKEISIVKKHQKHWIINLT